MTSAATLDSDVRTPHTRSGRPASPERPRLVAVPDAEPPFDDECRPSGRLRALRADPARTPRQRTRAGTVATAARPAASALTSLATAVAVAAPAVPDLSRAEDIGVRRTSAALLPPATRTGTGYARALTEVLTGVRPAQQLRMHCTPPVFAGLDERAPLPGTGLARLHSAHVTEPVDGVAEVSAVFRRGPRMRAIAFRLEGLDGRWRITALHVG